MKPSTASVMLPLVLTIASVAIGDKGAAMPLGVLLVSAVAIKAITHMRAMAAWKAFLVTFAIWFSVLLIEQKMHPEIACYRAAGGSIDVGLGLIPYAGPILNFISNTEQLRRDNHPDRVIFKSNSPMVEKVSMPGMGMMFAFSFGVLRLPIRSAKKEVLPTLTT